MRNKLKLVAMTAVLAGCTVTIQPLKPDLKDPHRKVMCEPYHPPVIDAPPDLPEFTARERCSDRLFKRKLAVYTEDLQDYIAVMRARERHAYEVYLENCPSAQ